MGWENFAIAQVGAAAALAGLVLVGVSVNLRQVLAEPAAPGRIAEALVALLSLLIIATLLLIPDQPSRLLGAELVGVGVVAWTVLVLVQRWTWRTWLAGHPRPTHRIAKFQVAQVVVGQLATLPFIIAGVAALLGKERGLVGVAVGAIGVFSLAFLDAWILLIELQRVGIVLDQRRPRRRAAPAHLRAVRLRSRRSGDD